MTYTLPPRQRGKRTATMARIIGHAELLTRGAQSYALAYGPRSRQSWAMQYRGTIPIAACRVDTDTLVRIDADTATLATLPYDPALLPDALASGLNQPHIAYMAASDHWEI